MERGSDKHGPRMDESLKAETDAMMRAGRDTRIEEWNSPEPSGEDEPDADRSPDGTQTGGTPPGMDADDVQGRSELATFLGKEVWPADREQLIELAIDRNAPDRVVDLLRELPGGRTFANVNEVWITLGGGVEAERS